MNLLLAAVSIAFLAASASTSSPLRITLPSSGISTSTPGRAVASSLLIAPPHPVVQVMPLTSKLTVVSSWPVAGTALEVLPSVGAAAPPPSVDGAEVSVPPHPETANDAVATTATAKKVKNLMVFSIKKKNLQPRTSSTLENQHCASVWLTMDRMSPPNISV